MDVNFEALAIERYLQFPERLEKSRRNLIVLSAAALIPHYVGVHLTRLAAFGNEFPLENESKVYMLLLLVLYYELTIFVVRLITFLLHNNYISWIDHLKTVNSIDLHEISNMRADMRAKINSFEKFTNSLRFRLKAKVVFAGFYCTEVCVPIVVSAYAISTLTPIAFP